MNERSNAATTLQNEFVETFERASRAWFERVTTEMELWSELVRRLSATHSVPEFLGAYQECVAKRMQIAVEDGHKLFDDYRTITQKIDQVTSNGPVAWEQVKSVTRTFR
jgi:hypothetical protein